MEVLNFPVLDGPRLYLEPLAAAHSEGMFELWRHASVTEFSGPCVDSAGRSIALPASSRAQSDRLLDYWIARAREGTGVRWASILRDGGAFVGAVGFNRLGESSEYAYHFAPDRWGAGLASEASRIVLAWAFSNGAEVVEAFIESGNSRSIRLAERIGFELSNEPSDGVPRYVLERGRADEKLLGL